jgi:formylglycine-generating enzyme required for sulfatase activity
VLARLLTLVAALGAAACRTPPEATPGDKAAPRPGAGEDAPAAAAVEPASAAPADAVATNAAKSPCPEGMGLIPGGTYRPQKRRGTTTVEPFCIDATEVTVAAYKACVREGKCSPECLALKQCSAVPTQASWGDPLENQKASKACNGDREDRQDHPVNCVSWEEAAKYCEGYKKRLPSPEEWEWAAIGADPTAWFPWGRDLPKAQLCWSPKASRHDGTCSAGSHRVDRTPQGVFDLGGNVSEWVNAKIPTGGRLRMAFGASWYAMDDGYVRAALGGIETPSARNETIGFRCVRGPAQAP